MFYYPHRRLPLDEAYDMLLRERKERERREIRHNVFRNFDSSYYWDEQEGWMSDVCSKQKADARCTERKSSLGRSKYRWKSNMKR